MKRDENTKLYPCNRKMCGEKCYDECYFTEDANYAVNPDKYTTLGAVISANRAVTEIDELLHDCGYASNTFSNSRRPSEDRL